MDLKAFAVLLNETSDMSEIMPVIIYFKYAFNRQPYVILGNYFILSAAVVMYTMITSAMGIYNLHAYHLLAMIAVVFLYSFYAKIIYNTRPRIWVISILILLSVFNILFNESIYQFNSVGWT